MCFYFGIFLQNSLRRALTNLMPIIQNLNHKVWFNDMLLKMLTFFGDPVHNPASNRSTS